MFLPERDDVIRVFNESAAMEGNEQAFTEALDAYAEAIVHDVVDWLSNGAQGGSIFAPIVGKWIREDYLPDKRISRWSTPVARINNFD